MNLVTTSFWDRSSFKRKPLFLGEWCIPFSRVDELKNVQHEVAPYHWDDRDRMRHDYIQIDHLYESVLAQLSNGLSDIHNKDVAPRYWRIVLGPWLFYFISVLWERYHTVEFVLESRKGVDLITDIHPPRSDSQIPVNLPDYFYHLKTEWWNKQAYDDVLRYLSPEICGYYGSPSEEPEVYSTQQFLQNPNSSKLKNWAHAGLALMARRSSRHVILNSGINSKDLALLNGMLWQVPIIRIVQHHNRVSKPNLLLRKKLSANISSGSRFSVFLTEQLTTQIPRIYLEDFNWAVNRGFLSYPKNPESIITGYGFLDDDIFKIWAAEQIEKGAKLSIFQHGGQFGIRLFDQTEDHQFAISDRFYSWGWEGDNSRKIVPMSAPKLSLATRVAKPDKNGKILMIFQPTFRYSLRLSAEPVGPQIKRYLENQILFLNNLNVDLRRQTTLRLYSGEDHWAFKSRIEEEGYSELISDRTESFWQQLKKSRILILTYNSTTLLEALTLNFPTLMFWDPKCWELNDRAKPWFEAFMDLGVLYATPEGAAGKLLEIHDDVNGWWIDSEIQSLRRSFCQEFCRTSTKWKAEWAKEILKGAQK